MSRMRDYSPFSAEPSGSMLWFGEQTSTFFAGDVAQNKPPREFDNASRMRQGPEGLHGVLTASRSTSTCARMRANHDWTSGETEGKRRGARNARMPVGSLLGAYMPEMDRLF